ncbi:MAG: transporter substrate-binding domain-containing protein, partial [Chloroflexota bacterium]
HSEYFPSQFPEDALPVWAGLGEAAPTISTYGGDVPYPQTTVIPRLQGGESLRVAGIPQPIPDTPESERRFAEANLRLAETIAARWGVGLTIVPNTQGDPIGAVARGEADLALGVRPSWANANAVDFTSTYLLRGKRLMTTVRDDFTSLAELRGKWIGVFASEPDAESTVTNLAAGVNASVRVFTITDDGAARTEMLDERNIDAVFGDSLRLLPHIEADPETLKLSDRCAGCDPWYTREYFGAAVPRNDVDFRLLVEYTLQELDMDGTLREILVPVTVRGENVTLSIVPGEASFMGFVIGN